MPAMTGIELTQKILQIRPGIPIILASGFPGKWSPEELRQLGVQTWYQTLQRRITGTHFAQNLRIVQSNPRQRSGEPPAMDDSD